MQGIHLAHIAAFAASGLGHGKVMRLRLHLALANSELCAKVSCVLFVVYNKGTRAEHLRNERRSCIIYEIYIYITPHKFSSKLAGLKYIRQFEDKGEEGEGVWTAQLSQTRICMFECSMVLSIIHSTQPPRVLMCIQCIQCIQCIPVIAV